MFNEGFFCQKTVKFTMFSVSFQSLLQVTFGAAMPGHGPVMLKENTNHPGLRD